MVTTALAKTVAMKKTMRMLGIACWRYTWPMALEWAKRISLSPCVQPSARY